MDSVRITLTLLCLTYGSPLLQAQSSDPLAGEWVNANASTRGLVKIVIEKRDGALAVRAFGACNPRPCDWGTVPGAVYGNSPSDPIGRAFTAGWKTGVKETIMTGVKREDQLLEVTVFARFNDQRTNGYFTETLRRQPGSPVQAEKVPDATLSDDAIYRVGAGVRPPIPVERPSPSYTDDARRAGIQGLIVLEVVVRKDGTVGDVKVIQGLGYGLDESAIEAVKTKWRFKPATRNGEPVNVRATLEVSFKLAKPRN